MVQYTCTRHVKENNMFKKKRKKRHNVHNAENVYMHRIFVEPGIYTSCFYFMCLAFV